MKTYFIGLILLTTLVGCKSNNVEMHQMQNGNQAIVDEANRRVIVINQSDRIIDVVNIDLNDDEIKLIKKLKETNDKKMKVIEWPSVIPPKESYTVEFATRFYNDQCLFKLRISPWNERLANSYGFRVNSVELDDSTGFTLENIDLSNARWTRVLNENGFPEALVLSGKIHMTLESYMEIHTWSPTWNPSSNRYDY